jgi:hypothetical protein
MSIIVPHIGVPPQRHSLVPFLWKVRCSCGWFALAASEIACRAAFHSHQLAEEPFPSDEVFDTTEHPHERKN